MRRNCGRANKGSAIDLRMSDANDVTTQELREECEASPSITGEQRQSISFGSKFASVIPRFLDLSFFHVETRVNMGRPAQDCLEEHCGGLVSHTNIKGILDFCHVPLQPTIGFPVPRKKRKQIFILTPVPSWDIKNNYYATVFGFNSQHFAKERETQ